VADLEEAWLILRYICVGVVAAAAVELVVSGSAAVVRTVHLTCYGVR
jgi:hypothetical protein